jgi:hypothetical protein
MLGGTAPSALVLYRRDAGIWTALPSTVDAASTRVSAPTDRFGMFALGIPLAVPGVSTPTPTATSTMTPTAVPTATWTPAPAPHVNVSVGPAQDGRFPVALAAIPQGCRADNLIHSIRFTRLDNAVLEGVPVLGRVTAPVNVTLPSALPQITFAFRKIDVNRAATVQMVVTDGCGDWPTFVGAGVGVR